MPKPQEIEVFVAMNEDGDFSASDSAETAREKLAEDFGGELCRIVKLNVKMAPPVIVEANVTVADEPDQSVTSKIEG